jgi:Zn-dependent peptidase ImmA (M78 family)
MKQHLSNQETEELGESYIARYYKLSPSDSLCVDIEGFATECLGLDIQYRTFANEDSDTIGFLADGVTPVCVYEGTAPALIVFPVKPMVIDNCLLAPAESGRKRFTIAHEAAHYLLERMCAVPSARHHREYDSERTYSGNGLKELLSFDENRADRLAAALLMPKFNVDKALTRYANGKKFCIYGETIMTPQDKMRLQIMADGIGVSFSALKIRLKELGLFEYHTFDEFVKQDFVEGDFDDSDIEYDRRFGELDPVSAYLIHRSRREAARVERRDIKCPACGYTMTRVSGESNGYPTFKCSKCKFSGPIGLAYFRKLKHAPNSGPAQTYKKKNKR